MKLFPIHMKKNRKIEADKREPVQARFGMFGGVFTPCVLTILGVIMFMRTGFVIGYAGLWAALAILGLAKLITTLTTLSISAISTNTKMKGGGVYYMISRVLGPDFGGSIGITLYFAQAIGVAFYVIGFTEAIFSVLAPLLANVHLWEMSAAYWVSELHLVEVISTIVVIGLFKLTFKGADVAIKVQYYVLGILLLSVLAFIIGGVLNFNQATLVASQKSGFTKSIGFWVVFAIFFPATTGISAGANMSGDLKNPARSIPWGTIMAIAFTAGIYIVQMVLMAGSINRAALKSAPFESLQNMSVFGPLVIAGVLAATLSSALGSFLGAPRILQAMGQDRLMRVMIFFGKGAGATNEPRRATVLTFVIAAGIIWIGDLNTVAEIISMFFLIAYGMINLAAFVESKSGNPSFRPTFKYFHWTIALAGAIGCTVAMLKINDTYAIIALTITSIIYFYLKKQDIKTSYGDAKRGFIFQRTKDNLIHLAGSKPHPKNWRPVMVAVCENPGNHRPLLRAGAWLEAKRGLYSVAHIQPRSDEPLATKIRLRNEMLVELASILKSEKIKAFPEALVTDDFHKGLENFLQSYSVGALRPNSILLPMPHLNDAKAKKHFFSTIDTIVPFNLNFMLFKSGDFAPGRKVRRIDLWWRGEKNGSLMALFAYLITLNNSWRSSKIRFLRIVPNDDEEKKAMRHMKTLMSSTRISAQIEIFRSEEQAQKTIAAQSSSSDLVMLGMSASSAAEAKRSISEMEELLLSLPTTIVVCSNGEANIFA